MEARWAYAINQWKPNFDYFTRPEQHERAFKTISAAGFRWIELRAGTGRWDPLGRPEQIAANYGSPAGLLARLNECAIDGVSSCYFDPGERNTEEPAPSRSALRQEDHTGICESIRVWADFLREIGGTCLVVRPVPSYWQVDRLGEEQLAQAAACWNAAGRAAEGLGVHLALHVDFLSALRTADEIEAILDLTDPAHVGLALDTAELHIAGIDPVAAAQRFGARVRHVHLKDARETVDDEYTTRDAEKHVVLAGGSRGIERWFWELGEGGIDYEGVVGTLTGLDFDGWFVVESDQSPDPAASALLNGWTMQHLRRH